MLANVLLLLVFAAPAAFVAIYRWQWAFLALLVFLPFAGAVILVFQDAKVALLLKDVAFVLPCYLGLFLFATGQLRHATIPKAIILPLAFFVFIVLAQTVNPNLANGLVALIGVKVWLLYIPLMMVAAAYITTPWRLVILLRVLTATAVLPCLLGLTQWALAATIGYVDAISLFYGEAGYGATQGYTTFQYGGTFYRIPSTFSFSTQYFSFLLAMLPVTYATLRCDPSIRWRQAARVIFILVIVAGFLCGSRSAFIFVPMTLVLLYVVDGRLTGVLGLLCMLPVLLFGSLYLGGLDPLQVLTRTQELAGTYSGGLVIDSLKTALFEFPLGAGTGMNTGPARHAFDGSEATGLSGIESYYAKTIWELGIPGLLALIAFLLAVLLICLRNRRQLSNPGLISVQMAFLVYFIIMIINSAKGWILDVDPNNIYFWVFLGLICKLPMIEPRPVGAGRDPRHLLGMTRMPGGPGPGGQIPGGQMPGGQVPGLHPSTLLGPTTLAPNMAPAMAPPRPVDASSFDRPSSAPRFGGTAVCQSSVEGAAALPLAAIKAPDPRPAARAKIAPANPAGASGLPFFEDPEEALHHEVSHPIDKT